MDNSTVPEKKFQVTIVSHTHWDRAWYVTFQEFRARLVRLVDRLINLLQSDPEYRVFMLDGQMAVLEDYLEVRPQRQPELVKLCLEGRLKVGPWYVLADEFLVSPEALIRNLQLGIRMGEAYGGVSKIGYVPDGFGHISQLPQILRGFGIDSAFFWRGLGDEGEQLGTEFIWEAPDGSRVTTIWMPDGYHNISNLGFGIHWGDTSQMQFDPELAMDQMQSALDRLLPKANTNMLLLMNGIDHEEAEPRLPAMTALANQQLSPFTFTQGTLEEHLAQVKDNNSSLPVYRGEFRWGKYSEILQGVYATRIHLKQRNHQVETLFERYAEPLSALAWLGGAEVPEGAPDLLWTGWRWLLKNHPHDDIYGSGIDKVHEEMLYRFDQAEEIGNLIVRDSVRQLASKVDCAQQEEMPILVFNPLGWARSEMAVGDIDFEFDDTSADSFSLLDGNGESVPYQVLSDTLVFWMETLKANRKRRIRIAFPAQVPSCGYVVYTIRPSGSSQPDGANLPKQLDQIWSTSAALARQEVWAVAPDGAENNQLSYRINANGDLDVFDKTCGVVYPGLAHFEDIEDIGDEYSTCSFLESKPISTRGVSPTVNVIEAGPCQITLEVMRTLKIPNGLTEGGPIGLLTQPLPRSSLT